MRYGCWCCHKSVSSELPDDSIIRAVLVCPECIEQGRVTFPEDRTPHRGETGPMLVRVSIATERS
jgi:hypothetical protein